jgi:hypothetical protein
MATVKFQILGLEFILIHQKLCNWIYIAELFPTNIKRKYPHRLNPKGPQ